MFPLHSELELFSCTSTPVPDTIHENPNEAYMDENIFSRKIYINLKYLWPYYCKTCFVGLKTNITQPQLWDCQGNTGFV